MTCPYFTERDGATIYCETWTTTFPKISEAAGYFLQYCCVGYHGCPLFLTVQEEQKQLDTGKAAEETGTVPDAFLSVPAMMQP